MLPRALLVPSCAKERRRQRRNGMQRNQLQHQVALEDALIWPQQQLKIADNVW